MNFTFIKYRERWILLTLDLFAFNLAYIFTYVSRFKTGWFDNPTGLNSLITPSLVMSFFWIFLFALYGRYRPLYGMSRLDSLWNVIKTTGAGILFIYVMMTIFGEPVMSKGKVLYLVYWAFLVGFVGGGRVALRTIQHHLIIRGIALSPTLIVGFNERGKELLEQTRRFPSMGYRVTGFVDDNGEEDSYGSYKRLGNIDELADLIRTHEIREVLISLSRGQETQIERVIGICGQMNVGIKIRPELYQLFSGQVKTQGIYGVPLIEVFPDLMPHWERIAKRLLDIIFSIFFIIVSLPVMIITMIMIVWDTPGGAIYTQRRVGRKGKEFTVIKFRSMVMNAEEKTGAVWAEKDDPRITKVGKFIRMTRLDEFPQLFNVLKGDMSFVGPRPERKIFVDQFTRDIPLYSRRLNVKPGLTGWAQVKHKYDESIDDVKIKLAHDIFYLENMSLMLDLKIILQTIIVMLKFKGQ